MQKVLMQNYIILEKNANGLEIDAIIVFDDSSYCAIEIKLGMNQINNTLEKFKKFNKYLENLNNSKKI